MSPLISSRLNLRFVGVPNPWPLPFIITFDSPNMISRYILDPPKQ